MQRISVKVVPRGIAARSHLTDAEVNRSCNEGMTAWIDKNVASTPSCITSSPLGSTGCKRIKLIDELGVRS